MEHLLGSTDNVASGSALMTFLSVFLYYVTHSAQNDSEL